MSSIKMLLCAVVAVFALQTVSAVVVTPLVPAGSTVTAPAGGIILTGGNGKRYLWIPDHLQGICKVTPSIDDAAPYAVNAANCILTVGAALATKPGQLSYDPVGKKIYSADLTSNHGGIIRLTYDPLLNSGAGGVVTGSETLLLTTCASIVRTRPNAVAWNALDSSLYIVYLKGNTITKLTNAGANPTCSNNIQIGTVADRKKGLSLAFVGADLWEVDGTGLAQVTNAHLCTGACQANPRFTTQIVLPQVVGADSTNKVLYVGGPTNLISINTVSGAVTTLATTFQNIFGVTVPATTLGVTPTIFVADDITAGALPFQAAIWKVAP